jgi:hypothetical protein
MTALTVEADRSCNGGVVRRLPLELSANPFVGSLLSFAIDGYVRELTAGEPFAGIAEKSIPTALAGAADGDVRCDARSGMFIGRMALTGVAQDDAAHCRPVFASDDNTLTFSPSGNTLVGYVIGVEATNVAIILFVTSDCQGMRNVLGVKTLAATGNQSLTTADLNKLILVPSTGAFALTLPVAADCTGGRYIIKKNTADAVILTLTGAGAETIDAANTFTSIDAAYDTVTIVSDGTGWHIVAKMIA